MADKKTEKKSPFDGVTKYFKEVKSEVKKVSWPTFRQVRNNTVIVLICIVLIGAFIWLLDLGFQGTLGTVVENFRTDAGTTVETPGQEIPIDIGDPNANIQIDGEEVPLVEGEVPPAEGEIPLVEGEVPSEAGAEGNDQ
jgi:preprotein translocase subunit SecE